MCVCVCVCKSVLVVDARSARTSQAGHRLTEMFFTCLGVRLWFLSGGLEMSSRGPIVKKHFPFFSVPHWKFLTGTMFVI